MVLAPGALIRDNIELLRVLGEGGMGVVWVARNRSLDTEVAVKVLHAHIATASLRERFAHEARSVARIDSPHVVKIFDFGTTDQGEPFFVMEMLRGTDLETQIEKRGALSPADTAAVLKQLCRALGRAHELGLVHRDIKPANVFLVDGQGDLFVKVLDFGVAKQLGSGDLGLTATGAMMGTPYYMSPEQFVSPRDVDHRTDLWATAVLAYACLTGQLPFQGETVGALSLAVHKGEFVPPSQRDQKLPASLDAWFTRALEPKPELRFQTAVELADAFQTAIGGGVATAAAPRPVLELAETSAAPSPLPTPAASAPDLAPQPAATLAGAARSVADGPSRSRGPLLIAVAAAVAMLSAVVVVWLTRGESKPADDRAAASESSSAPVPAALPPPTATPTATPSLAPIEAAASAAVAASPPAAPKRTPHAPPTPPAKPSASSAPARPPAATPPSNCYVMVNGKLTIKPECL